MNPAPSAPSPNSLVDTLIAGYYAFTLIGDLCCVYNARANRTGTAVLLAWVFFTAYVAGQSDQLEDAAEEQLENLFAEDGPFAEVGSKFAGQAITMSVFGAISSKLGSRAASGLCNYVLMKRLGKTAMRMLQPAPGERSGH